MTEKPIYQLKQLEALPADFYKSADVPMPGITLSIDRLFSKFSKTVEAFQNARSMK